MRSKLIMWITWTFSLKWLTTCPPISVTDLLLYSNIYTSLYLYTYCPALYLYNLIYLFLHLNTYVTVSIICITMLHVSISSISVSTFFFIVAYFPQDILTWRHTSDQNNDDKSNLYFPGFNYTHPTKTLASTNFSQLM